MNSIFSSIPSFLITLVIVLTLTGCGSGKQDAQPSDTRIHFEVVGEIRSRDLSELSGLESLDGPRLIAHNDDGKPDLFLFDAGGKIEARFRLEGVMNRDWEDLTQIDSNGRRLLVVGDIGDNLARHDSMRLHFVDTANLFHSNSLAPDVADEIEVLHSTAIYYPDGAKDCEAMAYDSSSNSILFITKRDTPPRLYGVNADEALGQAKIELQFLGTVPRFRPPTRDDARVFGKNTRWISQPTGMDIDATGRLAAIITYRSLYLFERKVDETWTEAFFGAPREFLGPRAMDEEAIAFSPDMGALFISSEGVPAPVFRVRLPTAKLDSN